MNNFTYKDLDVLFEDNHIIVVVKPQNVPSQEDESHDKDMLTIIKEYLIDKYQKPGNAFVGLVHRLDRVTGGVMVFAKTSKGASRLAESMKDGTWEKKYLAVVKGVPRQLNEELVHYLLKDEKTNTVSVVPIATKGCKEAILHYTQITTDNDRTLLKIELGTGRSHQIRVQMSFIGNPVLGDAKYGGAIPDKKINLALWAYELKFPHPITGQTMTFRVFPPDEYAWQGYDWDSYLSIRISD